MFKRFGLFLIIVFSYFLICEAIIRFENYGYFGIVPKYLESIKTNTIFNLASSACKQPKYLPNINTYFKGKEFKTNAFGLRDKEYSLEKNEDTYRIILFGNSVSVGHGVSNDEVYHSVLEKMLNKRTGGKKVEIINFAPHFVLDKCEWEDLKLVLAFNPDMIMYQDPKANEEKIIEFQKSSGVPMLLFNLNKFHKDYYVLGNDHIFSCNSYARYTNKDYIYPADSHPNANIHNQYAEHLNKCFIENENEFYAIQAPNDLEIEWPLFEVIALDKEKAHPFFESYYFSKIVDKHKFTIDNYIRNFKFHYTELKKLFVKT